MHSSAVIPSPHLLCSCSKSRYWSKSKQSPWLFFTSVVTSQKLFFPWDYFVTKNTIKWVGFTVHQVSFLNTLVLAGFHIDNFFIHMTVILSESFNVKKHSPNLSMTCFSLKSVFLFFVQKLKNSDHVYLVTIYISFWCLNPYFCAHQLGIYNKSRDIIPN